MPLLVECRPDWTMIETLTLTPKRDILHVGNKSGVIKRLVKHYDDSKGVVDEDPGRPTSRFFQRFEELSGFDGCSLRVLRYTKRNNYLIVLSPRLEEWLLGAAKECSVRLRTYGLPEEPVRLHELINFRLDRVERLVVDPKGRSVRLRSLCRILTSKCIDRS